MLFLMMSTTVSVFAQLGGNATYQFLNLMSSPRQAALGGKVITNVDYDVTQALYNPATINVERFQEFFPEAFVISVPGKMYPVEIEYVR